MVPKKAKKVTIQNDKCTEMNLILGESVHNSPIHQIIDKIQSEETFHKKYLKELERIYSKMPHEEFMRILCQIILIKFEMPSNNPFVNTGLEFICKFIATYNSIPNLENNPCKAMFDFLLNNVGSTPHHKFRFCEFINTMLSSLGTEADLDESIWESILSYMLTHLHNVSQSVRAQAIIALTRLQDPDNPQDQVTKKFIYHLQNDPSPKVRIAVVSNIALNTRTIPYILTRMNDIDEKVRAHTFKWLMIQCQIRALRIEQRISILETGFNDESKSIRGMVSNLMINHWLKAFQNNYINFLSSLKLDDNETDLTRFNKVARLTLLEIFPHEKMEDLVGVLSFSTKHKQTEDIDDETEDDEQHNSSQLFEFEKCEPYENLTLEKSIYWLTLVEFFYKNDKHNLDLVLPDLSTFCEYLTKFVTETKQLYVEDWEKLVYQFIIKNLLEMIIYFDFCDDVGCKNLKIFLQNLIETSDLNECNLEIIGKILEILIEDNANRFQFLSSILSNLTRSDQFTFISDQNELKELLENRHELRVKISQLKVDIMDIREQLIDHNDNKKYDLAEKDTEKLNELKNAYNTLIEPLVKLLPESCGIPAMFYNAKEEKKLSTNIILKCLQLIYFVITSDKVSYLTLDISSYYNKFIRRQIESNQFLIRFWALKCSSSYGMLLEPISNDVFSNLKKQFFLNTNTKVWEVAILSIFDLLSKYGLKHFDVEDKQNKNQSSRSRQLFRGNDYLSQEDDDDEVNLSGSCSDVLTLISHFLKICKDPIVLNAILKGYCMISLFGDYCNPDIISHILLKYFDPMTDNTVQQTLGVFFSGLLKRGKQSYLQTALIQTIKEVLQNANDNPTLEIKPEKIITFVIRTTEPKFSIRGINIHDTIADTFLKEINQNLAKDNELIKVLANALNELQISDEKVVRNNLISIIDEILENENWLEKKSLSCINIFKNNLNGIKDSQQPGPSNVEEIDGSKNTSDELNRRNSILIDDDDNNKLSDDDDNEVLNEENNDDEHVKSSSLTDLSDGSIQDPNNYEELEPANPISKSVKKIQKKSKSDVQNKEEKSSKKQLMYDEDGNQPKKTKKNSENITQNDKEIPAKSDSTVEKTLSKSKGKSKDPNKSLERLNRHLQIDMKISQGPTSKKNTRRNPVLEEKTVSGKTLRTRKSSGKVESPKVQNKKQINSQKSKKSIGKDDQEKNISKNNINESSRTILSELNKTNDSSDEDIIPPSPDKLIKRRLQTKNVSSTNKIESIVRNNKRKYIPSPRNSKKSDKNIESNDKNEEPSAEKSPRKSERLINTPNDPNFLYSPLHKRKSLDQILSPEKDKVKSKTKHLSIPLHKLTPSKYSNLMKNTSERTPNTRQQALNSVRQTRSRSATKTK